MSDEHARRRARSRVEAALDQAWAAFDDDELDAAVRVLEALRDEAGDDPGVLELEIEIALARDDPDEALELCERWLQVDPGDPSPVITAAEIYLDVFGDAKRAVKLLREVVARDDLAIDEEADARWLLGAALEERHDHKGTVREWLAVLRLDKAAEPKESMMPAARFEEVAEKALRELPDEVIEWLANVPILVEERPSEAMVLEGTDPRILGLYSGVPMPGQSVLGPPSGSVIQLFRRNLERDAHDEEDLADEIRITVLHETAHYFGYDEDDLDRLGLG